MSVYDNLWAELFQNKYSLRNIKFLLAGNLDVVFY